MVFLVMRGGDLTGRCRVKGTSAPISRTGPSVVTDQDQPIRQLVRVVVVLRHRFGEDFAAFADCLNETGRSALALHVCDEAIDDCLPATVVDVCADAAVSDDFDISLGFRDEYQHAGFAFRVMQPVFEELTPRHVRRVPMPDVFWNQASRDCGYPEYEHQRAEDRQLSE